MVPTRSVLVVDPMEETREVLRTALEKRGVRILAADEARQGVALARRHRPDLIVVDLECAGAADAAAAGEFGLPGPQDSPPLVLLGSLRCAARPAGAEFLAKPYHYPPLIRKIESLLDATGQPTRRAA